MNGTGRTGDPAWHCVLCQAAGNRFIAEYRPESAGAERIWADRRIVSCTTCGLCQTVPVPGAEELRHYYQAVYRSDGSYGQDAADLNRFPFDNPWLLRRGRGIASLVADTCGRGSGGVLDVGAGYGHALWSAQERFGDMPRIAIECSPWCRPFLESNGVDVYPQDLKEALDSIRGRPIGLVIMSHILEHLPDPLDILRDVRRVLGPGGCLAIEVPNDGGSALEDLSVHEPHLLFFTRKTLTDMVEHAGFQVLFADAVGPKRFSPTVLRIRRSLARMLPSPVHARVARLRREEGRAGVSGANDADRYGGNRVWLRCTARYRA